MSSNYDIEMSLNDTLELIIRDAIDDWKKLEEKYNTKIFFNTGTLEASHRRTDGLNKSLELFNKTNIDYELLSAEEATEKCEVLRVR